MGPLSKFVYYLVPWGGIGEKGPSEGPSISLLSEKGLFTTPVKDPQVKVIQWNNDRLKVILELSGTLCVLMLFLGLY